MFSVALTYKYSQYLHIAASSNLKSFMSVQLFKYHQIALESELLLGVAVHPAIRRNSVCLMNSEHLNSNFFSDFHINK